MATAAWELERMKKVPRDRREGCNGAAAPSRLGLDESLEGRIGVMEERIDGVRAAIDKLVVRCGPIPPCPSAAAAPF